jgi:AAA15 family ATPase/GTPase
VRFFSESCEGARRQLIVTTHEAHLLNQELLRRDEYWFVEKDERTQETRLVPLTDFRIRNDLKLERGYMMGRFGAIPIICGMRELEALLECTESENANAAETTPS